MRLAVYFQLMYMALHALHGDRDKFGYSVLVISYRIFYHGFFAKALQHATEPAEDKLVRDVHFEPEITSKSLWHPKP